MYVRTIQQVYMTLYCMYCTCTIRVLGLRSKTYSIPVCSVIVYCEKDKRSYIHTYVSYLFLHRGCVNVFDTQNASTSNAGLIYEKNPYALFSP